MTLNRESLRLLTGGDVVFPPIVISAGCLTAVRNGCSVTCNECPQSPGGAQL